MEGQQILEELSVYEAFHQAMANAHTHALSGVDAQRMKHQRLGNYKQSNDPKVQS